MTLTVTMTTATKLSRLARLKRCFSDDRASQIVEFAVSLPVLILFVVGIFDFSNALSLKQKLTNAAREGARVAAADSANDLGGPSTAVPVSIGDAFQVVDNYLVSEKINDCGLSTAASPAPTGLTWTYAAAANGCPGTGITVAINRGCVSQITTNAGPLNLIGTCVTLTYAYKWEFNNVASAFGWTASGPGTITVSAEAFNEN